MIGTAIWIGHCHCIGRCLDTIAKILLTSTCLLSTLFNVATNLSPIQRIPIGQIDPSLTIIGHFALSKKDSIALNGCGGHFLFSCSCVRFILDLARRFSNSTRVCTRDQIKTGLCNGNARLFTHVPSVGMKSFQNLRSYRLVVLIYLS